MAGAPDRYRFIYNADWGDQVRVYDLALRPVGAGAAADLTVRIVRQANLLDISSADPMAPWRPATATAALTGGDLAAIRRALVESGFDNPAPRGLRLVSDGFYWVAMACRAGVFQFTAYADPSPGFAALNFPAQLYRHDRTGIAVPPVHPVLPPGQRSIGGDTAQRTTDIPYSSFTLEVGENGLVGIAPF